MEKNHLKKENFNKNFLENTHCIHMLEEEEEKKISIKVNRSKIIRSLANTMVQFISHTS